MASVTEIVNVALRKIGAAVITNLTDGSDNANYMNSIYGQTRDMLFEQHPWNFAIKNVKLAQITSTPVIEFDYEYACPSDFIRAVGVFDNDEGLSVVDHKIMTATSGNGLSVFTNTSETWLRYVFQVTDPNQMSPLFREYLSSVLAKEAAIGIQESAGLRDRLQREAEKAGRRARSADAIADFPARMPVGTWLSSRTGRLVGRRWTW